MGALTPVLWTLLLFAACGRGERAGDLDGRLDTLPKPPPGDTRPPTPPSPLPDRVTDSASTVFGQWTVGVADAPSDVDPTAGLPVVRHLRTGTHEDHDRVTVELAPGAGMPGYHLEYVDRPLHECGSGNQIHPVGDAWLELRLEPAQAHTEEGEPTLPGRELSADEEVLRRIYVTCDFEGVVSVVVAVASPNPFRVFRLATPPRIVVDVRH